MLTDSVLKLSSGFLKFIFVGCFFLIIQSDIPVFSETVTIIPLDANLETSLDTRLLTPGKWEMLTYLVKTGRNFSPPEHNLIYSCRFISTKAKTEFEVRNFPEIPSTDWKPNHRYRFSFPIFIPNSVSSGQYVLSLGFLSENSNYQYHLGASNLDDFRHVIDGYLIKSPPDLSQIRYWKPTCRLGCYDMENDLDRNIPFQWITNRCEFYADVPTYDFVLYYEISCPLSIEPNAMHISVNGITIDTKFLKSVPVSNAIEIPYQMVHDSSELNILIETDNWLVPAEQGSGDDHRKLAARIYRLDIGPLL